MNGAELRVESVSWSPALHAEPILHPTSFSLAAGRVLGVVGPNGAGKSTLLRLLYRFNKPSSGRVLVGGDNLWSLPPRTAARRVAAVLQEHPTDFALTVREIVNLGRLPHRAGFTTTGQLCHRIVDDALHRLDLFQLGHRQFSTLSGGERQRVMVARALAQNPQILVLDEPTNHLDIRHQLEVLRLIHDLNMTIVTSLHDLNMAVRVCDEILVLKQGRPLGFGPPAQFLNASLVSEAFRVDARQENLSPSNTPHFSFHLPNQPER
ncbi:ABC transporter ATP-binding protein [Parasedimentitalea maritima]|uniref:ATP-binding cassette domain-containing protein n=1 Tax=Parasedimentitalea maritima TaxID=2578117 RepID=A0A6A4RD95_9RHOB|nr:ABC transporter ATP-binding protein [Zongyanglinia marina]KAE9628171.1 ATP-binding cassette domain-containing protein [Zongyanglinia marina]